MAIEEKKQSSGPYGGPCLEGETYINRATNNYGITC